jgi:hypothetical protein
MLLTQPIRWQLRLTRNCGSCWLDRLFPSVSGCPIRALAASPAASPDSCCLKLLAPISCFNQLDLDLHSKARFGFQGANLLRFHANLDPNHFLKVECLFSALQVSSMSWCLYYVWAQLFCWFRIAQIGLMKMDSVILSKFCGNAKNIFFCVKKHSQ